jgi:O-antigen ligase
MTSPFLSRFLMLILFVMAFIAPLPLSGYELYSEQSYLRMALGVIFSSVILLLWSLKRTKESTLHVRYTKVFLLFFGFLIWEFVTLFWVKDIHSAGIALVQHSSFVIVFFLAVNLLSKKDFSVVLNVLVVALTFISIIGLLQYYFSDNYYINNLFYQNNIPAATFINKNMASHFVVMTLPVSLVLFLFSNKKLYVTLYSLSFFLGIWYLLYIKARQAYLALAVEILLFILFLGLDFWKNKLRSVVCTLNFRKIKLFLVVAVLLLLSIVGNFGNQGFNANNNEKFERLASISVEGGSGRIPLWINTIEMIKDHPIAGVGVDQWRVYYPLYYDRVSKDTGFNEKSRMARVHNEYIEVLVSVGLTGYLFLLLALYYVVRNAIRVLSDADNKDRLVVLSSVLGMTGFAVVAFFSFPIQSYYPAFMLMFFMVILDRSSGPSKPPFFEVRDRRYLSSFLAAALLLYSVNFIYKLLSAEHYWTKSLISKDINDKLKYSGIARQMMPYAWKHNQWNAVFLMRENRYKEAIDVLKKAVSVLPYNTFSLHNLQESYARLGDVKSQTIWLKNMLKIDGLNVRASSILVRALYIQKKYKEATIEYKRTKKNFEYFKGRSGFGPYHTNLAETALLVGDYKFFGYIYDDLIEMDATAENYVVYGIVEYQRTGNKAKAKGLFNKAIEIDQTIDIPKEIRDDLGL